MEYNWDNMVSIIVPKGLNGWQFTGTVMINGRSHAFPVGKATQVPEPVAVLLQKMIDEEAALKEVKAKNQHHDPHQHYVTDSSGNPVWEDRTHGGERVTVEWDGTYDKTVDTPGAFDSTFVNALFRYWQISDRVPSKAELFAEDTFYTKTNGELGTQSDRLFEGDGWYGRWNGGEPVSSDFDPDGKWPLVIVIAKPQTLNGCSFTETGIYTMAGSAGKKLNFASLTYGWFKQLDKKYIPDGIGGVQPDWNQNDETQPDYVKNRTHYSETASKTVFDGESDGEQSYISMDYNLGEDYIDYPFNHASRYTIVFDGMEYTNLAPEEINGIMTVAVRDEQFAVEYGGDGIGWQWAGEYFSILLPYIEYKHGGELSDEELEKYQRMHITIIEQSETIHTLDPKYLPPNITIPSGGSLTLTDTAGGKWKLVVGTDGALSTEAVT